MPSMQQQIEVWKARLLDLSRRNRLLNARPGRSGVIRLSHPAVETLFAGLIRRRRMPFAGALTLEQRLAALSWDAPATGTTMRLDRLPTPPPDPGKLATDLQPEEQERALYNMRLRARTALTEQGVNILFVGLGLLEWFAPDAPEMVLSSPLVLLPVEIQRAPLGAEYALQLLDDEIVFNPTLAHKLRQDHGLVLPELPDEIDELIPEQLFKQVSELVRQHDGWRVLPEAVLGLFSFLKLVMYHDLEQAALLALDHPLLALLAGVAAPPALPLLPPLDSVPPETTFQVLDADSSQQEAIASAHAGASFVLHGPPGTGKSQTIANIISEYMAAGKRVLFVSEKMAALQVVYERLKQCGLADFCLELHSHKAGKHSVLDALRSTLEGVSAVQSAPAAPLALTATGYGYAELAATRAQLNDYVAALHMPHGPLRWTAYQVYAQLARLSDAPDSNADLGNIDIYSSEQLGAIDVLLVKLDARRELLQALSANVWRGCTVTVGSFEQRGRIRSHLRSLLQKQAELRTAAQSFGDLLGLAAPERLSEIRMFGQLALLLKEQHSVPSHWLDCPPGQQQRTLLVEASQRFADLTAGEARLLVRYQPAVLNLDIDALIDRFARQYRSWTRVFRRQYYGDIAALRAALQPGQEFDSALVLAELQLAADVRAARRWVEERSPELAELLGELFQGHRTDWEKLASAMKWLERVLDLPLPRPLPEQLRRLLSTIVRGQVLAVAQSFESELAKLDEDLQFFASLFSLEMLPDMLADWTKDAASQRANGEQAHRAGQKMQTVTKIPALLLERMGELDDWWEFCELRRAAEPLGIAVFVDALGADSQAALAPRRVFYKRFCQLWLDSAYQRSEVLRNFRRLEHEALIERFRRLDQEQLLAARSRLHQLLVGRRPASTESAAPGSELALLRRELQKQRRHKPIRQLLKEIPELIGQLKPCLMMSPLSVSLFLDPSLPPFDLVIFDEASQIRTEEAIGALMRGKAAVVVGDNRQLPPTSFFLAGADEEVLEQEIDQDYFQSILDAWIAAGLPSRLLRWHYRSRHESLIAFSNVHLYERKLASFPSAVAPEGQGVRFVYVPEGCYERQSSRTNLPEAKRVVDLVYEQLRRAPTRSLGVVTFSQPQQLAVLHELERRRALDPDLESLFDEERAEPFFVKNLENVQGDERDVIIVGVGYGRDASGKLLMQFGPLNQLGGERRLNVAITRAREQVVLVSSIQPEEIDLKRIQHPGPRLLRAYMEYARSGGPPVAQVTAEETPAGRSTGLLARFEDDLAAALAARGLVLKRQIGHSDFQIDIAICDPESPDRYLMGVECDGADYRDAPTARDRERLREQVLAGLGWHIHRAWSAAWAQDAEAEIERVLTALRG